MQQVPKEVTSEVFVEWVVEGMLEKKASDVFVLDLRAIQHAVADFFIICTGNSDTQIDAISESIEQEVHKRSKQNPRRVEGRKNKAWVLLDYIDVVAHVFNQEKRAFYGLEELWGDATITNRTDGNQSKERLV